MAKSDDRFVFNKQDTAAIFGVSVQAFTKWQIEPFEKRGRQQLYYLPDVIKARGLSAQDRGSNTEAVEQKARLDRVRADRVELEYAREMREVVSVHEAAQLLESVIVAIRLRALALPTKIATAVFGCKSIKQVRTVLADAIDEWLRELARLDVADLYRGGDASDRGAAATSEPEQVGGRKPGAKSRGKRGAGRVADK